MAIPYFESQSKCFETIIDSDKILKEMSCVQISSLTIDEQFSFGRKDDGSYLLWLDVIFLHFSLISLKEKVFSDQRSVCLASTTERSPICFFFKKKLFHNYLFFRQMKAKFFLRKSWTIAIYQHTLGGKKQQQKVVRRSLLHLAKSSRYYFSCIIE